MRIAAIAICVFLTGAPQAMAEWLDFQKVPVRVMVKDDLPEDTKGILRRVFTDFVDNACPTLYMLSPGLLSATMNWQDQPAAHYRTEKFGWTTEISVMLIDQKLSTAHYYIGRGNKPGVITQKRLAADLCGMTKDRGVREVFPDQVGSDLFFPTP